MGLFDFAYGYMLVQWFFSHFGMSLQDQFLVSTVFGGIVGAFLFYIAPIERLMRYLYIKRLGGTIRRHFYAKYRRPEIDDLDRVFSQQIRKTILERAYDSSYLFGLKSKIASAIYILIFSILFSIFTPPVFRTIPIIQNYTAYVALAVGSLIAVVAIWEAWHLPEKAKVIIGYHGLLESSSSQDLAKQTIGHSLEFGNWGEAKVTLMNFDRNVSLRELLPALKKIMQKLTYLSQTQQLKNEIIFWQYLMSFRGDYDRLIREAGHAHDLRIVSHELDQFLSELYETSLRYKRTYDGVYSGQRTPEQDVAARNLQKGVAEDSELKTLIRLTLDCIEELLYVRHVEDLFR